MFTHLRVQKTDELPNVRVLSSNRPEMAEPHWVSVRLSKSLFYERPYNVIGVIKLAGIKEAPKDICKAKVIGTWKAGDAEDTQIL